VRLVRRRGTRAYVTYEAYAGRVSEKPRDLPITDARDRLADVVNEAAYTGQVTYLTRRGRRLAAIVSVQAAEAAERWEDEQLGRMADDALAEMTRTGETPVALDEVRRELGL
jgi:antitoxin Phd